MKRFAGYDLPGRFAPRFPPVVTQVLVALIMIVSAVGMRILIDHFVENVVPFPLIFPALVFAALLAGPFSGLLVIICCDLISWYFILPNRNSFAFATSGDLVSLVLVAASQLLLLWIITNFRRIAGELAASDSERVHLLDDALEAMSQRETTLVALAEKDVELRKARDNLTAIWGASSEGLTLCRAVRDEQGKVVDYWVLEVNDAHRDLTGATREMMLASPVSQIAPPVDPRWFETADRVLRTGVMQHFDVRSSVTGRWLNIRASRVSDDLFQQTFVDVTDRHLLEEQRESLLKEMSHRIMNNLQMVVSFLHHQAADADADTRDHLEAAQRRIQVLARLHQMLAYSADEARIDLGAYLSELCSYLGDANDRPDAVVIRCETLPLDVSPDIAVPLGFVATELVMNAIKYAYPAPATGEIILQLTRVNEEICLSISDSGVGMAEGKQDQIKRTGTSGLGTKLIDVYVQQVKGRIVRNDTAGMHVAIYFPA